MTVNMQGIEIALSKSKIALMLFGALIFVAMGLWFVIYPPVIENPYWGSTSKLSIVGWAAILFLEFVHSFYSENYSTTNQAYYLTIKA